MSDRIYLSAPDVGALEERYVADALQSGWIAPLGPQVDLFEKEMAERIGRKHAVALSSGTAALHLALLSRGLGPGDLVLTSTMTFAATANAITYTGAEPVFVDCLPGTGNMDPNLLEDALRELAQLGLRASAIVPVDLLGKAVNYTAIQELAETYGVPLIADAAESLGAMHADDPAGAWGDIAIFSFNGNKIMTTSGGGMLLTDDGSVAAKVKYLATQARQPVVHYEHTEVGYNYRLSNLLAALGRAQLSRLDSMISRRRAHREFYREVVENIEEISIFADDLSSEDNCWLTSILVAADSRSFTARDLREYLDSQNIESRPLWKPMHMQPVFKGARSFVNGSSEVLFERGLTLPSGSKMTDEDAARVGDAIQNFVHSVRN